MTTVFRRQSIRKFNINYWMHNVLVYLINFHFFINKKDSITTQQNVARNEDDNSQPLYPITENFIFVFVKKPSSSVSVRWSVLLSRKISLFINKKRDCATSFLWDLVSTCDQKICVHIIGIYFFFLLWCYLLSTQVNKYILKIFFLLNKETKINCLPVISFSFLIF